MLVSVTWQRRVTVGAGGIGAAVALVSSLNPLLAAGANNQLETRCSRDPVADWVYDRSSWTPLRWHCTVHCPDGSTVTIRPDFFEPRRPEPPAGAQFTRPSGVCR